MYQIHHIHWIAACINTPVAYDVKWKLDKLWRNVSRNHANATAKIEWTLDPFVANVENSLRDNYENTVRL